MMSHVVTRLVVRGRFFRGSHIPTSCNRWQYIGGSGHLGRTFATSSQPQSGIPSADRSNPVHTLTNLTSEQHSESSSGISEDGGPSLPVTLKDDMGRESSKESDFSILSDGNAPETVQDSLEAALIDGSTLTGGEAVNTVAEQVSSSWGDMSLQPAIALISYAHDLTGLPWWLSIGVATLVVRTAILPISLYTMRSASRIADIQDDLKKLREDTMMAMRAGNQELVKEKQEAQREFLRRIGISPGKTLLGPLVQFPVFITFFIGLRRMSQSNPDFATGGTAWFMDLASRDSTFVLPLLAGVSLLVMTELGGDAGGRMTPTMKKFMRVAAAVSVPATAWLPAAVFCYWIPNNLLSMGLNGALRIQAVRRALGFIPDRKAVLSSKDVASAVAKKQTPATVSPLDAARSYARKGEKFSPSLSSLAHDRAENATVKPVLLKTKPSTKKRSTY